MSDKSAIEWTDATWNPIRGLHPNRWICRKISPGCDNCYASTMNHRWGGEEYTRVGAEPPEIRWDWQTLNQPKTWPKPRRVFVCSMTDLFGEWVPDGLIADVFRVMATCPQHQFQVLTKRPGRWLHLSVPGRALQAFGYLPNVWGGVSIEEDRYCWRAETLRQIPAAVRFISAEPLLSPLPSLNLDDIDWLIAGGESGARHRPLNLDWVRDLRDRSQASGTAFFYKQQGGRTHAAGGRLLDGRTWDEYPQTAVLA